MRRKLLSILFCLIAAIGVQAQELKTASVTFSNFTSGSQYADNEKHDLGNGLVIYTTDCYFTTELRIYSSSAYNGYVISDPLPGVITNMTFNMGYSKDVLNVYGKTENSDWTLVGGKKTTTKYDDYTISFPQNKGYTCFKLDVEGENQIRIKSMSVTFKLDVSAPILPESCNFTDSKSIEIKTATEGATIYYTTDGTVPSASNFQYTEAFTITETTTVKAIAIKNGVSSAVSEETYTKSQCELPEITPVGGETIESATNILKKSTIVIKPKEYNTVTYSINDVEDQVINSETSITVDNVGAMKLTIISQCGSVRMEKAYYYNVMESAPTVTAKLTSDEIKNKKDTGEGYYNGNLVGSTCGDWTGYFLSDQTNGRLQLKSDNTEGYYIQSPEFPAPIKSVTLTFTASNVNGRGFVIMPSDYSGKTATASTSRNLGSATYDGTSSTLTVKFSGNAKSFKIYAIGEPIYFSQIEVVYENSASHGLSVGSTGWATLYLGQDAIIPDGVTCYTITSVTESSAKLSPITTGVLPAHTGVIVKATAGTNYTFNYTYDYTGGQVDNLLRGSFVNTHVFGGGYVLSLVNNAVGLYKAQETGRLFLNNAYKAYLPASAVPSIQQSNGLRFVVEGTTDIEVVQPTQSSEVIIYDLMGRRVEKMEKGIYIVNGRKVLNN